MSNDGKCRKKHCGHKSRDNLCKDEISHFGLWAFIQLGDNQRWWETDIGLVSFPFDGESIRHDIACQIEGSQKQL